MIGADRQFVEIPRWRRTRTILAITLWFLLGPGLQVPASPLQEPTLAEERAFRAAFERVVGAVVQVEPIGGSSVGVAASGEATPGTAVGSGLVIDPAGRIVTTSFAVPADVQGAVVVTPAGDRLAASVVGRDDNRGLVVLRSSPIPDAPLLEPAERSRLAPGQWTIAVGRGWRTGAPTMAVGVLSAVNRAWGRGVQTDAAISPANYGGALVDIRGRVIGIPAPLPADTAGLSAGTELYDAGIGFAVPLEDVLRVLPRLDAGTVLEPGLLGITYRSSDTINGRPEVASCRQGSPAWRAGIRPGDRLVGVDGTAVERIAEVRHLVAPRYAGDTLTLEVEGSGDPPVRRQALLTLVASLPPWRRATVGVLPAPSSEPSSKPSGEESGIGVEWVVPDGPAFAAGIVAGDVITAAGLGEDVEPTWMPVVDAAGLAGLLAALEPGDTVRLQVRTGAEKRIVTVVTAPAPAEVPELPSDSEREPMAARPVRVERLGGAEVSQPPLAILPETAERPLGVLVYFGIPHGAVAEAEAAPWLLAAGRRGVAVVLPGSSDPERWAAADVANVARSLATLSDRRRIDPSRVAFAGPGPGGGFAWLAAERLPGVARGVALWDAPLPRRVGVNVAEPGSDRWVLLGRNGSDRSGDQQFDRRRLAAAGHSVGTLAVDGAAPPAERLCTWVNLLGLL
jgi:serine protease Do